MSSCAGHPHICVGGASDSMHTPNRARRASGRQGGTPLFGRTARAAAAVGGKYLLHTARSGWLRTPLPGDGGSSVGICRLTPTRPAKACATSHCPLHADTGLKCKGQSHIAHWSRRRTRGTGPNVCWCYARLARRRSVQHLIAPYRLEILAELRQWSLQCNVGLRP